MSGLVLKLGPKERILINGAVVENGDRRSRLSIKTPDANILRLRDAIHPNDANTPVRRACLAVQLILSGDSGPQQAQNKLLHQIDDLSEVFQDPDSRCVLSEARRSLVDGHYYRALKCLRSLLAKEDRLLELRAN